MLSERVTIGQLLDSGIRLSWRESLAITQSIAAATSAVDRAAAGEGVRTDLLSGFALQADGTVTAVADHRPDLSLSELALFLVQLLPGENAPADRRPPAAVHLAIGRALELVEAPPFTSVDDFTRSLTRLEQGARSVLLRGVYERCIGRLAPAHEPASSSAGLSAGVTEPTEKVEKDRRTSGPRVDALRRMIRERDHHDYLVRAERLAKRSRLSDRDGSRADGSRAHGPSIDMLRRWLREADRQQFEMLKSAAHPPSRRRLLPFASLALAVCVTAGLGFVQRQAPPAVRAAASAPAHDRQPASVEALRAIVSQATPIPAGTSASELHPVAAAPADQFGVAMARVADSSTEAVTQPPVKAGRVARSPRVAAPGASKAAPKRNMARAPASGAGVTGGHPAAAKQSNAIAAARMSPDADASAPVEKARKWAPLRLLSAIRHRLSAAFTGA